MNRIDANTTVTAINGSNIIHRSSGNISLSSLLSRGEFLRVGWLEYRVCLDVGESLPHNNTHISICSKEDAWERKEYIGEDGDCVPIFGLDTSLGSVKQPSIGDSYLNNNFYHSGDGDLTSRISRGSMIRANDIIPLGTSSDPLVDASLSFIALKHSSYEVQTITIASRNETAYLTPSYLIPSGFRLKFDIETTSMTTSGGDKGCLRWDGSVEELKIELEGLPNIDLVEASKEIVGSHKSGNSLGVLYHITFVGDEIRVNVPQLQIIDIGSNGCADADDHGGYFSLNLGDASVRKEKISSMPFYTMQTLDPIYFDASDLDVKVDIENLSQSCMVQVSRSMNRHGYIWDVTNLSECEDRNCLFHQPIKAMVANGINMHTKSYMMMLLKIHSDK